MEPNPRAVVGANAPSLDDAISTFDFVGFLLTRYETLAMANLDERVDRACLRVLGILIETMNRETRTSWAGREYIAAQLSMTVKSVSNYIYQLKCLGYLISERRPTPQANNRVLMHYTLSKLQPAEIEAAIDRAISSIRGTRNAVVQFPSGQEVSPETSRQDGNSQSTVPVPAGSQKSEVPVREGTLGEVVPVTTGTKGESSCQDGHSNIKTNTTSKNRASGERGVGRESKSSRGTRLPSDWKLPRSWGLWAIESHVITEAQVRSEAAAFKDHWISKSGKDAVWIDWFATWRNWIRRSRKNYAKRDGSDKAAVAEPDLLSTESEHERQLELIRKQREQERASRGSG